MYFRLKNFPPTKPITNEHIPKDIRRKHTHVIGYCMPADAFIKYRGAERTVREHHEQVGPIFWSLLP